MSRFLSILTMSFEICEMFFDTLNPNFCENVPKSVNNEIGHIMTTSIEICEMFFDTLNLNFCENTIKSKN